MIMLEWIGNQFQLEKEDYHIRYQEQDEEACYMVEARRWWIKSRIKSRMFSEFEAEEQRLERYRSCLYTYSSARDWTVGMLRAALKSAYPGSYRNRASSVVSEAGAFQYSVKTSLVEGVVINIGHFKIHAPKYCSVHVPIVQMVLLAHTLYDEPLQCSKSMAPKSIYESSRFSAKPKQQSTNTGSSWNDVYDINDAEPEIHRLTPCRDTNIVDLTHQPLITGDITANYVNRIPKMTRFVHDLQAWEQCVVLPKVPLHFRGIATNAVNECCDPPEAGKEIGVQMSHRHDVVRIAGIGGRKATGADIFKESEAERDWSSLGAKIQRAFPVYEPEEQIKLSSAYRTSFHDHDQIMKGERNPLMHLDYLISNFLYKYNSCREWTVGMLRDALKGAYPESYRNRASCVVCEAGAFQFSVENSPKGGMDVMIGYYQIHVPKCCSVHLPIVKMVLFARTMYDDILQCVKSIACESIYESSRISANPKHQTTNTGSACNDVHDITDAEPENQGLTPCADTNILVMDLEELDHRVDLTHPPLITGDITANGVNRIPNLTSVPDCADPGSIKAEGKIAAGSIWLMDTGAVHHGTGNLALLSGVTNVNDDLFITARDGVRMRVHARGSVITDTVVLPDVWYIPELTKNVVSVSQLTELDCSIGFIRGTCCIRSATDTIIGTGHVSEDGLYEMDLLNVGHVI